MGGDQRGRVNLISIQEDVAFVSEKRLHLGFLSIPRCDVIDLHCPVKAWRRKREGHDPTCLTFSDTVLRHSEATHGESCTCSRGGVSMSTEGNYHTSQST